MTAAIAAAEAGAKVVLLEKQSRCGGCANFGMGILSIGTHIQQEQ